jgi:hypothetical protein
MIILLRAGEEIGEDQNLNACTQIKIGNIKTVDRRKSGKFRAIQHRFRYCSAAERYEERHRPGQKRGANRTIYCCSVHWDSYMCKIGKDTCRQQHLTDCLPFAH